MGHSTTTGARKRPESYAIRLDAIVALPEGREKTILARKALAAFAGLANTQSLKTYGTYPAEHACAKVGQLLAAGQGVAIPSGYEPRDPTDGSKTPVSLEAFCRSK